LTAWMEEDESGKQSCAWDIVSAVVERGRLGYKEEEGVSFFLFLYRPFLVHVLTVVIE